MVMAVTRPRSHALRKMSGFITCQWGVRNTGTADGTASLVLWLRSIYPATGGRIVRDDVVGLTPSGPVAPGTQKDMSVIYILPAEPRFTLYTFSLVLQQTGVAPKTLATHDFGNLYDNPLAQFGGSP